MENKCDVLIIGAGTAGIYFGLKMAPVKQIFLIKGNI